ncbi:TPA: helix-turn-helix domain-containing protein [Yersinia enterocolitica]|uniref:helix-turn-helix domain-containing protein n=1 Tax=Yersinia enterocolitica TaxID=630 RepID=UPI0021E72EBE|nr:helix-turn-helix transcriptional regulator [Yersinia enterocolitica]UYK06568.1 helix-turn-helix domain-containing protein [Yersinia enterocolitica]HDL6695790.1 helix-turn-helix transcriptional regulator [Yersinia enterocolitica]HDL6713235.1 helix-turn-helix transcriptional regulator [Yersinia enterocolitica]HDL7087053.1 helix-turn-helix transcriptional regulator [Yersinia enterocolitica]HDL7415478.1 helix-turn-helix transcriptional regulator [Yersinia enterocolitica]
MMTSSSAYGKKLRDMRLAEGITQQQLSEIAGIGLGTIKNYETGQRDAGIKVIEQILALPIFEKYALWLMTGKTSEAAGQISPALSPDGPSNTSDHQNDQKVG